MPSNPKIIVAEDEQHLRIRLSSALPKRYKVYFASNTAELLSNSMNPSFAIIDHNFCANKGLEALANLKSIRPKLPIIFITSYYSEEICLRAFRLGARDFFRIPFATEDILRSIELIAGCVRNAPRTNALIGKYIGADFEGTARQNSLSPSIERAIRYIEESYCNKILLRDISKAAHMSKHYLCREFKKQIGDTCIGYLNIVRVREAAKLLAVPLISITEASLSVGYNDLAYFIRVFKKHLGCTPKAYKTKLQILNSEKN